MFSKYTTILFLILISQVLATTVQDVPSEKPYFTNIELSHDDIWPQHVEPTIAIDTEDNIFVGYKNAETDTGGGVQVSFTLSEDGGNTWNKAYDMKDIIPNARQSDPWMVTYNNTLYYAYLEFISGGQSQLTMAFTSDKGKNWEYTKATTNNGFADKETFDIDSTGTIYMAYDDVLSTSINMRLSRSDDGGYTFHDNSSLQFPFSPDFLGPYIVASNNPGELYVSWTQVVSSTEPGGGEIDPSLSDVYFSKSLDYGNSWSKGLDINPLYNASTATTSGNRPSKLTLTAMDTDANGRIYIVWCDISNQDNLFNVYMRYSDTGGDTWSKRFRVNDNTNSADEWMPALDIDQYGIVHLAYYESTNNEMNVKYRYFNPYDVTFSNVIRVSNESTSASFTRPGDYLTIKVDSNNVPNIVWSDGRDGALDIYFGKLIGGDIPYIPTTETSTPTSTATTPTPTPSQSNTDKSALHLYVLPIMLIIIIRLKKSLKNIDSKK